MTGSIFCRSFLADNVIFFGKSVLEGEISEFFQRPVLTAKASEDVVFSTRKRVAAFIWQKAVREDVFSEIWCQNVLKSTKCAKITLKEAVPEAGDNFLSSYFSTKSILSTTDFLFGVFFGMKYRGRN